MSEIPLVHAVGLTRYFDVSPPLLNRVLERKPKMYVKAVEKVDFNIYQGETFALVGESGCGKTTVARMLVGLERPTDGIIEFDGHDISSLKTRAQLRPYRRRMQMIFQDPFASLNPRWRVMDIVAEPMRAYGTIRGRRRVREEVFRLLRQVGLSEYDARALSTRPDFVVCDEPTSALDVSVQAQILNLMKRLQQEMGLSYLLITHDLAVVHHLATHVGVMYLGKLCEIAAAESVFNNPRHPYTKLLLETLPDISMGRRDRPPMAGEVPNPMNPPPGCVFHPRCPLAADVCTREIPRQVMVDNTMIACHAVAAGWNRKK